MRKHDFHRWDGYRRCACRDDHGRQLGARCPNLSHSKHGTWTFAVDMPSLDHKRKTMCRGGFATKADAQIALDRVLDCERAGILIDDKQTVAHYLHDWLQRKMLVLKPTTVAGYDRYVRQDLIPALGAIKLEKLRPQHVSQFVRDRLNAGRGATTLRRKALLDMVPDWRLFVPATGAEVVEWVASGADPTKTVVWLDDIDRIVGGQGLTVGTVRRLVDRSRPVLLVGTSWPDHLDTLARLSSSDHGDRTDRGGRAYSAQ